MDKDSQMITAMSNALIDLQVKYRSSNVLDRMEMMPSLEELFNKFSNYQIKLLEDGVITTEADLIDMVSIKSEIATAANKQQVVSAILRTIAFVVTKI